MNERDLRSLLLSQPVPDELMAEERTWDVVRTAFAARTPLPDGRRVPVKALSALAVVGGAVALALTPPGPGAWSWVRDHLGRDRVVAAAGSRAGEPLPAAGSVLAVAPDGVRVLAADGSLRLLGAYDGGVMGPRGLLAAVWEPSRLLVLDPAAPRYVHWELAGEEIADVRWSASGFRLAYRAGDALRVVVENGTNDRRLAAGVAPVAPAWRPGDEEVLAYADRDGRVHVVNADSGRSLWVSARAPVPVALAWAPDGKRLAVLTARRLRLFSAARRLAASLDLPAGTTGTALVARPEAAELAFAVRDEGTGESSAYLWEPSRRRARLLFAGAGELEGLAWSPDGRFLLLGWKAANEWVFVPAGGGEVLTRPDVSEEAGGSGFPRVADWCCRAAG